MERKAVRLRTGSPSAGPTQQDIGSVLAFSPRRQTAGRLQRLGDLVSVERLSINKETEEKILGPAHWLGCS